MKKKIKKVSYVNIGHKNIYKNLKKEKQIQKMEDWLWDNHYSKLPRIHILFEENQCSKE